MACGWAMWAWCGTRWPHTPRTHAVRRQRGCKAGVAARLFVWWVGTGALSVDNMPHVSHHHLHTDNAHHAPPRPHHRVCVDGPVCAPATPPRGHAHTTHTTHGVARRGAAPPPAHHHHTPSRVATRLWCGTKHRRCATTAARVPRQHGVRRGHGAPPHAQVLVRTPGPKQPNPPWARRGSARVLPRQRGV